MRTSSVFKSRWMALIWAAGILWFAYDFAGSQDEQQPGSNTVASTATNGGTSADDNKIAEILGG